MSRTNASVQSGGKLATQKGYKLREGCAFPRGADNHLLYIIMVI